MHPIERLRYVARAANDGAAMLVPEAAGALSSFSEDPAALVTACRRLVDRQPRSAPMWWLAARVLESNEPRREAWAAADELEADTTVETLIDRLPADATVVMLGWPEIAAAALAPRGDLEVLLVDALGEGGALERRLERAGREITLVEERGAAAAARYADLVVLEAHGLGPDTMAAVSGSLAAAASARLAEVPVWAVAGVGRILPARLWAAYCARLDDDGDPWDSELELIPLALIDQVVGPTGLQLPDAAVRRADCPSAPELLKRL